MSDGGRPPVGAGLGGRFRQLQSERIRSSVVIGGQGRSEPEERCCLRLANRSVEVRLREQKGKEQSLYFQKTFPRSTFRKNKSDSIFMSTTQGEAGPLNPAQKRLSEICPSAPMEWKLIQLSTGCARPTSPKRGRTAGTSLRPGATQTSSSLLSTPRTPAGRRRT